jgi:DNA-binding transcriptional MerR regulator
MTVIPNWITAKEAARLLGVQRMTLLNWHDAGIGPPHYAHEGRRTFRRYIRDEVIAWREKQRREG